MAGSFFFCFVNRGWCINLFFLLFASFLLDNSNGIGRLFSGVGLQLLEFFFCIFASIIFSMSKHFDSS